MTYMHSIAAVASIDVKEILRPKAPGEQVNSTVQIQPKEPQPNYDEMRRLANGENDVASIKNERFRKSTDGYSCI